MQRRLIMMHRGLAGYALCLTSLVEENNAFHKRARYQRKPFYQNVLWYFLHHPARAGPDTGRPQLVLR